MAHSDNGAVPAGAKGADDNDFPESPPSPSALHTLRHTLTTYEGWVGNYDYSTLCMPRIPFLKRPSHSIFFGLNDRIPILVAVIMGFQHSLAMAGSVTSVPRIITGGGDNHLNFDSKLASYVISTALTVCGLMTLVQIIRIRLFRGYYIGTGLISMSGTSFTFLPIAEALIQALRDEGRCGTGFGAACERAVYGKWLGTVMICSLLEVVLSFLPPRILTTLFPPVVAGSTVFLIGASLVGVGIKYWGGGAGPCYNYMKVRLLGGDASNLDFFAVCPNIASPARKYPWGDSHWIGLGFFVFAVIVLIGIFGSPFLRNIQVMVGLIAGIVLAAATGYINTDFIDSAPAITFPFVETFPLSVYWPAVIPTLIAFLVSAVESIGDISATAEVSRVATEGPEFESRVQGGLLADGVNSLVAALLTANPTTTFSENNGVIALTRTANKYAGIAAACFLIFYGIIGKVGGLIGAAPDAVIGGMTTFLFANVAVSGLSILSTLDWNVRNRFIIAITIGLGLGVSIEPKALSSFIPEAKGSFVKGLRLAAVIILETGYTLGAVTAMILNLVLPKEDEEFSPEEFKKLKNEKEQAQKEKAEAATEAV